MTDAGLAIPALAVVMIGLVYWVVTHPTRAAVERLNRLADQEAARKRAAKERIRRIRGAVLGVLGALALIALVLYVAGPPGP